MTHAWATLSSILWMWDVRVLACQPARPHHSPGYSTLSSGWAGARKGMKSFGVVGLLVGPLEGMETSSALPVDWSLVKSSTFNLFPPEPSMRLAFVTPRHLKYCSEQSTKSN